MLAINSHLFGSAMNAEVTSQKNLENGVVSVRILIGAILFLCGVIVTLWVRNIQTDLEKQITTQITEQMEAQISQVADRLELALIGDRWPRKAERLAYERARQRWMAHPQLRDMPFPFEHPDTIYEVLESRK